MIEFLKRILLRGESAVGCLRYESVKVAVIKSVGETKTGKVLLVKYLDTGEVALLYGQKRVYPRVRTVRRWFIGRS